MDPNSRSRMLRGPEDLRRVLPLVLDLVDPGALGVKYRLAGTAGALAQGVHLPAGFGTHVVPVVRLELRLVSELVRDRPDRYQPLIEHMRSRGADLDLVRRAMSDRAVDPALQERILGQFNHP